MSEPHRHTGAVTKVAGPIVTDYDHGKPWWQNDRVPFESSLSSHDRQMRATRLSTGIGRLALIRAGGIGLVALTVLFAVIGSRQSGVLPASIFVAAGVVLMAVYLVMWREALVTVNALLVKHPSRSGARNPAVFLGTLVLFPMVTLLLPLLIVIAVRG
jgi:hypothetical protein